MSQFADDRRCLFAATVTASALGVPFAEIMSSKRLTASIARARHVAIYLSHVALGVPLQEVARGFGRDRTTAVYAIQRVEDRRDDPDFDRQVEAMEAVIAEIRADHAVSETGLVRNPCQSTLECRA